MIMREGRPIPDVIHAGSAEADLTIIGFALPAPGADPDVFFERMDAILDGMPTTLVVHSARNFESEPVLFS